MNTGHCVRKRMTDKNKQSPNQFICAKGDCICCGSYLLSLLAIILILAGVLMVNSPGKPQPFLDENGKPLAGSISEKVFMTINGVEQGMFIKGRDVTKPVLLYLHGGMPDYFLTKKYPTGLEDIFTVVWWEQRGSGISYSDSIPPETMNQEQMISDTLELTNYLRDRFHQDKIYLMGHSGGSFIGIQAAARAPELYHAYLGVAQMSDQLKSEKLAYDYMLQQFRENGNTKMARALEAAPGHYRQAVYRMPIVPSVTQPCTALASARPMTWIQSSPASFYPR